MKAGVSSKYDLILNNPARGGESQSESQKLVNRQNQVQTFGQNTSRIKQRRFKKTLKQGSVLCISCSAEYHISCLVKAYKDFRRGSTKSQRAQHNEKPASEKRAYNKSGQSGNHSVSKSEASAAALIKQGGKSAQIVLKEQLSPEMDAKLEAEAISFLEETLGIESITAITGDQQIRIYQLRQ